MAKLGKYSANGFKSCNLTLLLTCIIDWARIGLKCLFHYCVFFPNCSHALPKLLPAT